MSRRVLITGAARGIGASTAAAFRAAGWRVVGTARTDEGLALLSSLGVESLRLDVADEASVERAAREALAAGPVHVLVNNAGYAHLGPVELADRDAWRRQFETNVFGAFDLARRLVPAMRAQGGGRVIQLSSVLGRVATPFTGVYAASKHALEAATDAFRVEVRPFNVRVTLVEPGPVTTEFTTAQMAPLAASVAGTPYARQHARLAPLIRRFSGGVPPEAVARVIVKEATRRRPRARRLVGWLARVGVSAHHLTPPAVRDVAQSVALGPPGGSRP